MRHQPLENKYLTAAEAQGNQILLVNHPQLPEFKLVWVEGGRGSIEELHKNTSVAGFYMAAYPVTQELYEAVIGENPSRFKGKRRPVEEINWYDSVKFCQKLNDILELPQAITGNGDKAVLDRKKMGFRLPTDAEWEYATGGGLKQQNYQYAGSRQLHTIGWYDDNNDYETRPVGLKLPNILGLYDMSGNVWEWCWDWYDEDEDNRVLRGGSWFYDAGLCRVAYRNYYAPDDRYRHIGLRLVLSSSL